MGSSIHSVAESVAPARPREAWIDVAKGVAILLVALHHTWQFLGSQGWSVGWWDTANEALTTLRMPLFFTVSGMLAANATRATVKQLWAKKIALLLYLYLLWCLVRSIWFSFVAWPLGDFSPARNVLLAFALPSNGLWYLYALAVFTFLIWAARRLAATALLAAAGVASVAIGATPLTTGNWVFDNFAVYFLFFAAGSRFRSEIFAMVKRTRFIDALILSATYLGATALTLVLGGNAAAVARIPLSVLAVCAGLAVSLHLSRALVVGRLLESVGKQTLPIYVTHVLIVSLVVFLPSFDGVPAAVAMFIVTPTVAIIGSLTLHRVVRFPGVYTLPKLRASMGRDTAPALEARID